MADPHTDSLIAAEWPDAWGRARSKQRNNLRRRWRQRQEHRGLRALGARCGNCKHFNPNDPSPGLHGSHCELHSDYYGFSMVDEGGLCLDYKPSGSATGKSSDGA